MSVFNGLLTRHEITSSVEECRKQQETLHACSQVKSLGVDDGEE